MYVCFRMYLNQTKRSKNTKIKANFMYKVHLVFKKILDVIVVKLVTVIYENM